MNIFNELSQWVAVTDTCEIVSQVMIIVFGLLTPCLTAIKSRWTPVVILAAQPFWFVTAFVHCQWGVFALTLYYTIVWARSFASWWYPKKVQEFESEKAPKCA